MIEIEVPQPVVEVGQKLHGRLVWTAEQQAKPKHVKVALGWRTEGRGDVDRKTTTELKLEAGSVSAGDRTVFPFEFLLPNEGPISYDGSLLRILWEITVLVDLPGLFARDEKYQLAIRVLPRGGIDARV